MLGCLHLLCIVSDCLPATTPLRSSFVSKIDDLIKKSLKIELTDEPIQDFEDGKGPYEALYHGECTRESGVGH